MFVKFIKLFVMNVTAYTYFVKQKFANVRIKIIENINTLYVFHFNYLYLFIMLMYFKIYLPLNFNEIKINK